MPPKTVPKKKAVSKKKAINKVLDKVNSRKIPKSVLKETLEAAKKPVTDPNWNDMNDSCAPGIHQYYRRTDQGAKEQKLMRQARTYLMRRDWVNLAKLLMMCSEHAEGIMFPIYAKYALLHLAHNNDDKDIFNTYLQSVHQYRGGAAAAVKLATTDLILEKRDVFIFCRPAAPSDADQPPRRVRQ